MRERLLTRHFVQRFLENDLVSPDSDRHAVLSLVGAGLLSSTMFITIALSLKFMFMPLQSPGRTAILAVDDRLLFLACAMIIMALVAVTSWDALSLDPRDSSILGPLPIAHGVIVRAKLRAVALFAAGFALATTAMPALVHPALMVGRLPSRVVHRSAADRHPFRRVTRGGPVRLRRDAGGSRNAAGLFGTALHPAVGDRPGAADRAAGHLVPAGARDPGQCRPRRRDTRAVGDAAAAVLVPGGAGNAGRRIRRSASAPGPATMAGAAGGTGDVRVSRCGPRISDTGSAGADRIRRCARPGAVCLHLEQPAAAVPAGRHPRRSLRGAGRAGAPGHAHPRAGAGDPRRLLLHGAMPAAKRAAPAGAGRVHCRVAGAGDGHFSSGARRPARSACAESERIRHPDPGAGDSAGRARPRDADTRRSAGQPVVPPRLARSRRTATWTASIAPRRPS